MEVCGVSWARSLAKLLTYFWCFIRRRVNNLLDWIQVVQLEVCVRDASLAAVIISAPNSFVFL